MQCVSEAHACLWLQVKARPWEKRLVDESCGREVKELLQKAAQSESDYLKALAQPGTTHIATTCCV